MAASVDQLMEVSQQTISADSSLSIGVDVLAAYERGKTDINFFAALALPEVAIYALPYFYIACFQLIVNRTPNNVGKILRFALGLPRGHAKTTFVKILLAWLIVYDKAHFIMIVCATEGNAQNILEDVSTMLGSYNMVAVYGDWDASIITDNKETKIRVFHNRRVTMEAKGAQSSLRGMNKNFRRPDVILCDDLQTKENDASPTESAALLTWFVATLLKIINDKGDRLILYIGNMYSEKCLLKLLQNSKMWISLITGAILDDGKPLWPELHSIESLMESYLHDESLGKADEWFAEIMNDPRNPNTSLIKTSLPLYPEKGYIPDGVFITVDPAGYRVSSDDNVIVVHELHGDKTIVANIDAGVYTPKETVMTALGRAMEFGASVIGVESSAYQQTLKYWVEYFIAELGISGIEVIELKPHGRSKENRIRAFIQEVYEENYYFKREEDRAVFTFQGMKYKIGAKNNKDDILDAVAYGVDVRRDHWPMITNNLKPIVRFSNTRVVENNTPF